MFEDKAFKRNYLNDDAQFSVGMKVTTVKENSRVEQHEPTRIDQPRKMETSLPTQKKDLCPFKINIRFNNKDDLFDLSKDGSVHTHSGPVRRNIIFARGDQPDTKMEKIASCVTICLPASILHDAFFTRHMCRHEQISQVVISQIATYFAATTDKRAIIWLIR
jgi:hypothetical protein